MHLEKQYSARRGNSVLFVGRTIRVAVMAMSMVMMAAAAQQPRADNIHRQPQAGDRNGLGEVDRYGLEQARDGLITNQDGNHREDDGARKTCQVAEFPSTEAE